MLNNYNTKALKSKNVTNFFHLSSGKTRIFVGFFTILLLIGLAIDPKPYIASTLQGLIVFASVVLPALLPFFVLTRMLTSLQVINSFCNILSPITKFLFKAPAISSYIFFISIISGYPVGAKLTAECYEQGLISSLEAQKISTFTSNSGPMFIIGTVGVGLLFSKEAGFVILLSHILGGILNGVFYRRHFISQNSQNKVQKKPIDLDKIFDESVHYSVLLLLKVGAYIALFFTLNELLVNYSVFEFLTKLFIPIFNFLKLDL
ncbi:MAG: hypothetical protein PHC46_02480, partial [Clostridia bacterium]|nr:hypothetical protein [Clostridia bacterium]